MKHFGNRKHTRAPSCIFLKFDSNLLRYLNCNSERGKITIAKVLYEANKGEEATPKCALLHVGTYIRDGFHCRKKVN